MPTDFSEEKSPYWGFWATIGFSLLVFVSFSILQATIVLIYGFSLHDWSIDSAELESVILSLAYNGDAISIAEIPSALIGTFFVVFLAYNRKILTIKEYLDLRTPNILDLLKWLGLMILVVIIMESVNVLLDRETPDFMSKVYESTTYKPLLWIAVVIGAPFFEEFLFRGFLLEGLRHSKLGVVGAIFITSAIWAVIHLQYGTFEIFTIFLIGIVLAMAKIRTKSLYVPIAMHLFMNLTASVLMEFTV